MKLYGKYEIVFNDLVLEINYILLLFFKIFIILPVQTITIGIKVNNGGYIQVEVTSVTSLLLRTLSLEASLCWDVSEDYLEGQGW